MTARGAGRTENDTKKSSSRIGTRNESSLHQALKFRYALPGETEKEKEGFVCDAIGPKGEVIEIQTGNFGALKKKLPALAKNNKVRLIYPVIVKKTIELYDINGAFLSRTRSSKKGTAWDIFSELVYFPELIKLRGITIELVLVDAVERRRDDGKGARRRKRISIEDRVLESCRESIVLKKKADWRRFVPVQGEFTIKTLALIIHTKYDLAQKTLYVLEKAGLVRKLRKEGRTLIYQLS